MPAGKWRKHSGNCKNIFLPRLLHNTLKDSMILKDSHTQTKKSMQNSAVAQMLISKKKENFQYKLILKAKHQMANHCVKTKHVWHLLSKNLSDM